MIALGFKSPLFYLVTIIKSKISDASNLNIPKASHKKLPVSEKVEILKVTRENIYRLKVLRPTVRTNILSMKL